MFDIIARSPFAAFVILAGVWVASSIILWAWWARPVKSKLTEADRAALREAFPVFYLDASPDEWPSTYHAAAKRAAARDE